METVPEMVFLIPLYWQIERHVYKWSVLSWKQVITNLAKRKSANENELSSISWPRFDLMWRMLAKRKL